MISAKFPYRRQNAVNPSVSAGAIQPTEFLINRAGLRRQTQPWLDTTGKVPLFLAAVVR
jgi:hypothetical protein